MSADGWNGGYLVDLDYLCDYFAEMDPQRVRLALLQAGLVAPEIRTACELGFGQGVSVVVHGTAGSAVWWGNDFMPGHVAHAQSLARAGGAAITLLEDSFAELNRRDDLPMFDYVALHGVWSWVSAENRATIVEFLRRRLAPGGVVYLSYNVRAGWARPSILQNLLKQFTERHTSPSMPVPAKIDAGLAFIEHMLTAAPPSGIDGRLLLDALESLKALDRAYLAHEFLHDDLRAFDVSEVCRDLAAAKLTRAGTANLLDALPSVGLTADQAAFLDGIDDPILHESTRDVMVGQRFRRDLFVRGPRPLGGRAQVEAIRGLRIVLVASLADLQRRFAEARGTGVLRKDVFVAVIDRLADLAVHTVGEVFDAAAPAGTTLRQTFEAICLLVVQGDVGLPQSDAAIAAARPSTAALNAHLLDRARDGGDIAVLASPVTGGGIACDPIERLFLEAATRGLTTPRACAERAFDTLAALDRPLQRDGAILDAGETLAELTRLAGVFLTERLPHLRRLGVAG